MARHAISNFAKCKETLPCKNIPLAGKGAGFSGNGKVLPFKKYLSLDLFWNQPFEENYNIIACNTNTNPKHYSTVFF